MTLLFDKRQEIASPALAPIADDIEHGDTGRAELSIALINNMPDSALKATERQFQRLIEAASRDTRVRFHCFSLPAVARSSQAKSHIEKGYRDIGDLRALRIDGMIVTGAEPIADTLREEPYWRELTEIIDWAKANTRSTIWSCLAAHAAVLHLDRIERQRLPSKCHGIFDCETLTGDALTRDAPAPLKVSHSRLNEVTERDLTQAGYQVLTRSAQAGVDVFVRQYD